MDINNYQERLKAAQDKLVKLNTTKDKYIQKINKLKILSLIMDIILIYLIHTFGAQSLAICIGFDVI